MLRMIRHPDGTAWFYVEPRPVSVAAFRQLFGKHDQAGAPTDAVIDVSYNEARSYATTRGGRLLTSEEWDAATVTPGVQLAGDLLEWIDSPDESKRAARQRGKSQIRTDQPQPDVTFRLARSP